MPELIAAAVRMMAAHVDPFSTQAVQEWTYHTPSLDIVLTITHAADGPVWEVVGYVPRGQKVHRIFAVGNQPSFGVHSFNNEHVLLVPTAIREMDACRPVAGVA